MIIVIRRTILTFLMVALSGCTFVRTYVEIRDFEKQIICFPESMISIENGVIQDALCTITDKTFIVHFRPEDCVDCRISHISDHYPLLTLSEQYSFDVMLIISPSEEDHGKVVSMIRDGRYLFPIYVDSDGLFLRLNPNLPSDSRFSYFLINESRHPVFVGNPLTSQKLYNQFVKQLMRYEKN